MPRAVTRRRLVLIAVGVIGALMVGSLALALAKSQRDARRTVEERFAYGANAASALVGTIVSQAYASNRTLAEETLRGSAVRPEAVRAIAERSGGGEAVVLDGRGAVLAAYPSALRPAASPAAHVRRALAGTPAISGILQVGGRRVVEVAVPFESMAGRRVVLLPTRVEQVQQVLGPYLAGLPGPTGHRGFVLDDDGQILAAARPASSGRPASLPLPSGEGLGRQSGEYVSVSPVTGTSWRIAETVRESVLYAPVEGWSQRLPWILLLILVPVGLLVLWLADRAGRAADQARHASGAKSAFLANMSHELRTPMTTILGFSEMLREGRLGGLTERQQRIMDHIYSASKHLNGLIGEALDLARVEEGRLTFHPESIHPHRLVAEVAESMSGLAADRGVEIHVDAPDLGVRSLDPARFKQVLYNLIGNAVKFTEAGGRVSVHLRAGDHSELALDVADTGPGIDVEDQQRIFLPFEQGAGQDAGGAGLGLAVSRRIIDAQGGQIALRSSPGNGSTFTVTLPAPRP
jgi:signal transduction histidine kinase